MKKHHWHAFRHKKLFEKQLLPHCQACYCKLVFTRWGGFSNLWNKYYMRCPFCLHYQVKPLGHSHDLPPPGKKGRTYICSCMIFMHPTDGAKLVLKKWIEELQAQPWSKTKKSNDQPAFNWALNKTAGQVCADLFSASTFHKLDYWISLFLFSDIINSA